MKTDSRQLPAAKTVRVGELRPRFSIVTVCRNAEAVIESTGRSLRQQTWRDYEWLIIDGASTDGTRDLIGKLDMATCRVISESDAGIYDAMNKAVSLAGGEWVYFLNAGDVFADESVLADVASHMDEHPSATLVWGDMIYFDPSVEWLRRFRHVSRTTLVLEDLNHQAVFAARELFQRLGRFNCAFRVNADYDWLLRVFRSGTATSYVPRVIARFAVGGFHSHNLEAADAERRAVRLQYVTAGVLSCGLQYARIRRRWRLVIGHGG